MAFYRLTLKDGTLPFIRLHPRTFQSGTFKFTGEPPKLSQARGLIYMVAYTLRLLP